jgi:O-antigen biosynthesis protein
MTRVRTTPVESTALATAADFSVTAGWHLVAAKAQPAAGNELVLHLVSGSDSIEVLRARLGEHRSTVVLWLPHGKWTLRCVIEAEGDFSQGISVTRLPRWRALFERCKLVLSQLAIKGPSRRDVAGGLLAGWRFRGLRGVVDVLMAPPDSPHLARAYRARLRAPDQVGCEELATLQEIATTFPSRPTISVLMPVFNPDLVLLGEAVDSVEQQSYAHWELCIADDASTDPAVRPWLAARSQRDPRIRVVYRQRNGHISAASNSALDLCAGQYIALLDQDDLLPPHALHCVVACLNEHPEARLVYSDEDKIDEHGNRYGAYHKPDWNPELILGQNVFSHLGVFEKRLIDEVGGFREGFEGSQDYDLLLRCLRVAGHAAVRHVPHVLYHWRALPGSTARSMSAKSYAAGAALRALQCHLDSSGLAGAISISAVPGSYRFLPEAPRRAPSLSILLPEAPSDWKRWRKLAGVETYPGDVRVLVAISDHLKSRYVGSEHGAIPVVLPRGTGLAARFNSLAEAADTDLLLLLDARLRPVARGWLIELASLLYCPEVVAVGARIIDSRSRVLHAGYVLGLFGSVGSPYEGFPRSSPGYFGQLALLRSASAVSAAGMLVRREGFNALGGFDAATFPQYGFDVDFGRRAGARGMRILVAPATDLIDAVADSRDRAGTGWYWPGQRRGVTDPISDFREGADPYYSPHLALLQCAFQPDPKPRVALPWQAMNRQSG